MAARVIDAVQQRLTVVLQVAEWSLENDPNRSALDAGVNVAAGSDNMNDMWFAFGRLDPVETA